MYKVCRVGRESLVEQLLKNGKSLFRPDFLVWKPVEGADAGAPLHRLFCVEVKYRADIDEFLRRSGGPLGQATAEWPDLYVVLVTDDPAPGRSCFQILDPRAAGGAAGTIDLHLVERLDIWKKTVEEYEGLVRHVFSLLGAAPGTAASPARARKPAIKLARPSPA